MITPTASVHSSRFVVVGAGGLGGPMLYALAAAEPDELAFLDDDRVELSNLQRQVQFSTADLGRPKVAAMADELVRRGVARARLRPIARRFTWAEAPDALRGARVVLDASDNLATKFAVNDACVAAGVPCVIAGVLRHTGQVLAVVPGVTGCYRCLFEAPPPAEDVADCGGAGVLGAAVAVVAGYAARAALALAEGDHSVAGHLLVFEDLRAGAHPRAVHFRARPDCPLCHARRNALPDAPIQVKEAP